MNVFEKPENIVKTTRKAVKYSKNPIALFLKYIKKIDSLAEFDDYLKDMIYIPLIEFGLGFIFRSILILICLLASHSFFITPHLFEKIYLSMGISLLWELVIQFKNELVGGKK